MEETREILRHRLTAKHFEFARASISSGRDRLEFARFHYHEIKARWDILSQGCPDSASAVKFVLHDLFFMDEEADHAESLHAIAAHTLACVQSLHAIADIFAYCLFYSLGYGASLSWNEARVNAPNVINLLAAAPEHRRLSVLLSDLCEGGDFSYLEALSNHSKHRSIIRNSFTADNTGTDPVPLRLKFQSFSFKKSSYSAREVLPVLESEFNRISKSLVYGGIELNAILKAPHPPPNRVC